MLSSPRALALLVVVTLSACRPEENLPPTVTGRALTTAEDTPLTFTLDAADPEGQPLVVKTTDPAHGVLTRDGASYTYTPAANFFGIDAVEVTVGDGTSSTKAAIDFTVTPVNDAPLAGADALTGSADVASTFEVARLLMNDSDVDGDPLTVTGVGTASRGSVALSNGLVTYTPSGGQPGEVTWDYTLSDGVATTTATVTLTLSTTVHPPVALDDVATTDEDTAVELTATALAANDADVDGDPLTVTAVSGATHGTATLAAGTITFTPDAEFSGEAGFDYTVSDGTLTDQGHVTITVTAVNDAPVAVDDTATATEDTTLTLASSALLANDTDVDGPTLTVGLVSGATGGTVSLSGNTITFIPSLNATGAAGFDYTVTDGTLSDTGHVVVTINAVDDAPVAADDTGATQEDTALTFTDAVLVANDVDADQQALIVSAVGSAVNGTVTRAGGVTTFTPAANFAGQASFEYTVSDGSLTDVGLVTITVSAVNDAPVAVDDTGTTAEDTAVTFTDATLRANDSDLEGATLTITAVGTPVNGTVTHAGGVTTFTPAANFSGSASFEYTVSDGALTDVGLVIVTVTAVNDAPVAVDDTGTTAEDTAVTFTDALLRANDTDVEGATLTITAVGAAVNGTVSRTGGVTTFTPAANFSGTASFEYTVSDGAATDVGLVTVTVTAVNDAPVAVADARTTAEDTAATVTDAVLLANDTDAEGTALTITAVGSAVNGTVSRTGGVTTFTPAANFSGTASFQYTVTDGALTATATVTVTVTPVNDAPVAVADTRTTSEDTAATVTDAVLLANDSDVEGTALTITAVGSAVNGTVSRTGGVTTFTPAANFNGTASFQYTVTDGALTATATVTVTVTAVNDAPVAVDDVGSTAEATAVTFTSAALTANDTDVDGPALSVTAVGSALNGVVTLSAGVVTFTPTTGFAGTASFNYTVSDGSLTDVGLVTVTVSNVNDPPVAVDDTGTTQEDTAVTFTDATLLANDVDPDSVPVITAVGSALNGVVTRTGGVTTFTPTANFSGTASFQYTVSDGTLTDVGQVTVTVTAVNDAPVAVDDTSGTLEDTALTLTEATLLGNDVDVDGPALSISAVQNASGGSVSFAGGIVTFTPAANSFGAASFEYVVSDGTLTDVGVVNVTVTSVDDVPVAVADSATTAEETPTTVDVLANDTGLGDGSLSVVISVSVPPAAGTASVTAANGILFTPAVDFTGTTSLTYEVQDGDGDTASGTLSLTVTNVNDAPVATAQSASTNRGTPLTLTLAATDVDSPSVTFAVGAGPAHGSLGAISGTGLTATVVYTPTAGYAGTDSFTFTANDGALGSAPATVSLTVVAVPVCGDGLREGGEACDDSNLAANDGCSATCTVEVGWSCVGSPSVCTAVCGDTLVRGAEQCDDGNASDTDGCTTQCKSGRVCSAVTFNGASAFATDPANGTCYATWTTAPATWGSAEASCEAVGGYLVSITSAAEQARVASVRLGVPWIGATDDSNDTDTVFIWYAPTAWGFTAFAPGEPDDDAAFGGNGECLAMVNASGEWGDTNCDFVGYVDGRVCEFPANGCGDGLMVAGEACDDGNTASSDGCSSTCTVEPGATCSGNKPTTCSKLVINEIDYDNPGTDDTGGFYEFVEIYNAGTATADLTNVALVLINGANGSEYFFDTTTGAANVAKRVLLTAAGVPGNSLPVGGYVVVGPAALTVPASAYRINLTMPTGGFLQGGAPDAVMLFRVGATPAVIDALSYEGASPVATVTGVAGTWAVTEGSPNTVGDAAVGADSLCRMPNGRDTQNNATDFQLRPTATPGAVNN